MFDKLHSQKKKKKRKKRKKKKKKKKFDKLCIMNELRPKHRLVWRLLNKLKGSVGTDALG